MNHHSGSKLGSLDPHQPGLYVTRLLHDNDLIPEPLLIDPNDDNKDKAVLNTVEELHATALPEEH